MNLLKTCRLSAFVLFAIAAGWIGANAASGLIPDRAAPDAVAFQPLVGTWKLTEMESQGHVQPAAAVGQYRWIITADTITIMIDGEDRGSWTYQINGMAPLSGIDLTPRNTLKPPTYPSAFHFDGNRLTVCLQSYPERGRPKDLISRPDSGVGKFTFERMK